MSAHRGGCFGCVCCCCCCCCCWSQARDASFRTIKTIAECLADEIVNASKGSSNSYAIKRKDEVERVAKANR